MQAMPAADVLFSPVLQRVLGLLYGQPGRRYLGSELIRLAGAGTGATHRVLKRLEASGLARVESEGRQLYYQANPESPVYEEMLGLVRKLLGVGAVLRDALAAVEGIEAAFLYGSFASGTARPQSDIDVLVIGDVDYGSVYEALVRAEAALGRRVDPTITTAAEWRARLDEGDTFVRRISDGERLFLFGSEDEY